MFNVKKGCIKIYKRNYIHKRPTNLKILTALKEAFMYIYVYYDGKYILDMTNVKNKVFIGGQI